ncbi:MAG: hypothetical protein WBB19_04160 [Desulforhopalus sp.]
MMKPDPSKICFGLTEEIDRQSLVTLLKLGGQEDFSRLFAERLSSEEIIQFVDQFMILLRKHLSESEYHRVFLGDQNHHHQHKE